MLTTIGAALDPLSAGLARRLAVKENQEADALPSGLDLAQDGVAAHATQRGATAAPSCITFTRLQRTHPSLSCASERSLKNGRAACARWPFFSPGREDYVLQALS